MARQTTWWAMVTVAAVACGGDPMPPVDYGRVWSCTSGTPPALDARCEEFEGASDSVALGLQGQCPFTWRTTSCFVTEHTTARCQHDYGSYRRTLVRYVAQTSDLVARRRDCEAQGDYWIGLEGQP